MASGMSAILAGTHADPAKRLPVHDKLGRIKQKKWGSSAEALFSPCGYTPSKWGG